MRYLSLTSAFCKKTARGAQAVRGPRGPAPVRGAVKLAVAAAGVLALAAAVRLTAAVAPTGEDLRVPGTRIERELALPEPVVVDRTGPGRGDSRDGAEHAPHAVTVAPGDSLYGIFRALGVPQADLQQVLASGEHARRLADIRPARELVLFLDSERRLQRLVYHMDETRSLHVERRAESFESRIEEVELERRTAIATGTVESALFVAGQRAGLSDQMIMRLVSVFAWDVDFALDIRAGDRFTVLYEELYKEGEKVGEGEIIAAEFVNRGRDIRAVRYTGAGEQTRYYSPQGRSMRKAFLRTPVKFSRISSRFNLKRKHPILHTVRAHRGVDYAAPTGTPVKATGDGKVIFAGRKGGYGKTIMLRHGSTYTTVYAHLSRIAVPSGRRVEQGQTIGYVGSTGLATGPHLHYEFRVRGVHRDPLTVSLPEAEPIPEEHREAFLEATRPLVAQLDLLSRTSLAVNR